MPTIFDVIRFWKRRDHGCPTADLANPVQDDFRSSVISLDRANDFDRAAFEPSHVTDIFKVARKNDHCEWARLLIFAEVQKVNALDSDLHANDLSGHAFDFTDMVSGFVQLDAVRGVKIGWCPNEGQ